MQCVLHFEDAVHVRENRDGKHEEHDDGLLWSGREIALEYEAEPRIETVLPAQLLGVGIGVDTVVEAAAEEEEEAREHEGQEVVGEEEVVPQRGVVFVDVIDA